MKKEMLLLVAIGCLAPMNVSAICFKYVAGPEGLDAIVAEVDATKIGSNLPSLDATIILTKGGNGYRFTQAGFEGKTVYVTIKEYKGKFSRNPILIRGEALESGAAYDISIDNNKNVTFTKVADCTREFLIKYGPYATGI